MQKHQSFSLKKNYYSHFLVGFFVFMVSFLVAGLASSVFTPVGETSAQTVKVQNNATGYYVAVSSADKVSLAVDATPTGSTVVSDASTVNVKTNAPLGYKLYLSTENDELTATDSSITQTFKPVTSTSLTTNTWGFSTDSSDTKSWLAIPEVTSGNESSGYLLASKGGPNIPDGDNINVYYGINSDTTMPSGTYTTTITYTAIGDGIPEEHTMQEFTMSECINMPVDQIFYLIDSRNNKIYSIIHAKDGNCWMTQDLALDGGITLTPVDSNVSSNLTLQPNISYGTAMTTNQMQIISQPEGYDGNFYNWCATMLLDGNACYNASASTSINTSRNICPKGWKVPAQSGTPNYYSLINSYGYSITPNNPPKTAVYTDITGLLNPPFNFSMAGDYYNGYNNTGSFARYITSTLNPGAVFRLCDNTNKIGCQYEFSINKSGSYYTINNYNGKHAGSSVRCALSS